MDRYPRIEVYEQPLNIQTEARDKFAGIIWLEKTPDRTLDEYFSEYDHWETYSEHKTYNKKSYNAAYKGIMRQYANHLCILTDNSSGIEKEEYYVLAKRLKTEHDYLEKWCTCLTCRASIFNPLKYVWCPICTKCIKSGPGFASDEYMSIARKLRDNELNKKHIPKSTLKTFMTSVKFYEYTIITTIILFIFYVIF